MQIQPFPASGILSTQAIPLMATRLECGFPSPAEDHMDRTLDLNEHLIASPAATYFARANGDSLSGLGIEAGDLLIVSRAVKPISGSVVVASIDGELVCKILDLKNKRFLSANVAYEPIPITDDLSVCIEGVVTHAVHYLLPGAT